MGAEVDGNSIVKPSLWGWQVRREVFFFPFSGC